MEKKPRAASARKKVVVTADVTVAVTHRHKKQETANYHEDASAVVHVPAYEPSHEEAAKLAYSYYVARGYQAGNQSEDWFRAVQELKQRHVASLLADPKA